MLPAPVYEAVVRQALTAEPTVTVRAGKTVTDLVVRPGQVPVVEGVVTGAGETIRAGLVVDAAGRRSRLSAMLEAHGARPAPATKEGCPLMYISRYYRLRSSRSYMKAQAWAVPCRRAWRSRFCRCLVAGCCHAVFG